MFGRTKKRAIVAADPRMEALGRLMGTIPRGWCLPEDVCGSLGPYDEDVIDRLIDVGILEGRFRLEVAGDQVPGRLIVLIEITGERLPDCPSRIEAIGRTAVYEARTHGMDGVDLTLSPPTVAAIRLTKDGEEFAAMIDAKDTAAAGRLRDRFHGVGWYAGRHCPLSRPRTSVERVVESGGNAQAVAAVQNNIDFAALAGSIRTLADSVASRSQGPPVAPSVQISPDLPDSEPDSYKNLDDAEEHVQDAVSFINTRWMLADKNGQKRDTKAKIARDFWGDKVEPCNIDSLLTALQPSRWGRHLLSPRPDS